MALEKHPKSGAKLRGVSKPKVVSKPALSKETISDSDSDSSSGEAGRAHTQKTTTTKVTSVDTGNAAKKKKIDVARETHLPKANGGSKMSEPGSPSGSPNSDSGAEPTPIATSQRQQIENASADSSSDDSDDNSDAMQLDTPQMQERTATSIVGKSRTAAIASRVASDWKPPEGFSQMQLTSKNSSALKRKLLVPSALKGKELWHISIPEDLESSLSTLSTISPASILHGAPVLTSEEGYKYTFRETRKRDAEESRILVPDADASNFKQVPGSAVTRSLDLRHMLPSIDGDNGHDDAGEVGVDVRLLVAQKTYQKEAPPSQPEGLQMVNVPIGVVTESSPIPFRTPQTTATAKDPAAQINGIDRHATPKSESKENETPEDRARRRAEKAKRKAEKEKNKLVKSNGR